MLRLTEDFCTPSVCAALVRLPVSTTRRNGDIVVVHLPAPASKVARFRYCSGLRNNTWCAARRRSIDEYGQYGCVARYVSAEVSPLFGLNSSLNFYGSSGTAAATNSSRRSSSTATCSRCSNARRSRPGSVARQSFRALALALLAPVLIDIIAFHAFLAQGGVADPNRASAREGASHGAIAAHSHPSSGPGRAEPFIDRADLGADCACSGLRTTHWSCRAGFARTLRQRLSSVLCFGIGCCTTLLQILRVRPGLPQRGVCRAHEAARVAQVRALMRRRPSPRPRAACAPLEQVTH